MIKGIGTDIVDVDRVKTVLGRQNHRFVERILTLAEQAIYAQHHNPVAYLAKRFAAKEALAKALGTGIAKGVGFQQIEIVNEESGEPKIVLTGDALKLQQEKGINSIHLSLSDEKNYAVAFVVLES